jgi:hypothetical protein
VRDSASRCFNFAQQTLEALALRPQPLQVASSVPKARHHAFALWIEWSCSRASSIIDDSHHLITQTSSAPHGRDRPIGHDSLAALKQSKLASSSVRKALLLTCRPHLCMEPGHPIYAAAVADHNSWSTLQPNTLMVRDKQTLSIAREPSG